MKMRTLLAVLLMFLVQNIVAATDDQPVQTSINSGSETVGAEFSYWFISSDIQVQSSLNDIIGTNIDVGDILGVDESTGVFEFNAWLRLLKRHRLIFGFVPFRFDGESSISQDITFKGIDFNISETINTSIDINWFNVFYEFDLIYNDYGILGFRVGGEFFDVDATLDSSFAVVSAQASAVAPAVGIYAELYVTGSLALEGKLDGFILDLGDVDVQVFDLKANARYDITDYIAVSCGLHWLSIDVTVDEDKADVSLFGPFISASIRF